MVTETPLFEVSEELSLNQDSRKSKKKYMTSKKDTLPMLVWVSGKRRALSALSKKRFFSKRRARYLPW